MNNTDPSFSLWEAMMWSVGPAPAQDDKLVCRQTGETRTGPTWTAGLVAGPTSATRRLLDTSPLPNNSSSDSESHCQVSHSSTFEMSSSILFYYYFLKTLFRFKYGISQVYSSIFLLQKVIKIKLVQLISTLHVDGCSFIKFKNFYKYFNYLIQSTNKMLIIKKNSQIHYNNLL